MKKILLLPFLFLVILTITAAQAVELYYISNQKAYLVNGIKDGQPNVGKVHDGLPEGYTGSGHDDWWVVGTLPMKAGMAFTIADYKTKRVAHSYGKRNLPRSYTVQALLWKALSSEVKNMQKPEAMLIFGWLVDGKLTRFHVTAKINAEHLGVSLDIPEEEFGGMPICWIIEDGEVLPLESVHVWDRVLIEGEEVDPKELSLYRDNNNRTALHFAAANGDVQLARKLLGNNNKLVKKLDRTDVSPLSHAVENGRSEMVQLLLEHRAPLSDGWGDLTSIVRKAASSGHFEVLKMLAPGRVKGSEGKWHYSWAASDALNMNYEDIAMYLIEQGADFTIKKEDQGKYALSKFSTGYPELGFRLMEKFKLDSSYDIEGNNLLHSVASYADLELLKTIANLGVDMRQESKSGLYPVDMAIGLGNVDAICWFLDNGGREVGVSAAIDPLKHAILKRQLSSVECLIGYGYDVNKEISPNLTPLMYSVYILENDIGEALANAGGVFLLDSPHIDMVVAKIIEADNVYLLNQLIEQGWEESRRVHGAFTISECSSFFKSSEIMDLLNSRGWNLNTNSIQTVKVVDEKPRLLVPIEVDYPVELQERFGEKQIRVKVAVAENGVPTLLQVKVDSDESELVQIVENAVYGLRFSPAKIGDNAVPFSMQVRIPLDVEFDPASIFSLGEVSVMPKAITQAKPYYPYELQHRKAKGSVVVEFVLLADGSTRDLKVAKSSHPGFNRAAIQSIRDSRYSPAFKDGKPVACRIRVSVNFSS